MLRKIKFFAQNWNINIDPSYTSILKIFIFSVYGCFVCLQVFCTVCVVPTETGGGQKRVSDPLGWGIKLQAPPSTLNY